MTEYPMPLPAILAALRRGLLIPAHPLALDNARKFDERHQRALTRYYHAAGAGGVAVGVHTTQFAIREARYGLFRPVMQLAAETARACDQASGRHTVLVAGICGKTDQALQEARLAREAGYHVGLLSLAAFKDASDEVMAAHCAAVAHEIPLMGFYLQPAAGGRLLSEGFWRRFVEIPNVAAIKIAPFNRYQTLDVVRAVASAGRAGDIALYTGNDDHIVLDLLTEYAIPTPQGEVRVQMAGGLLGHWACWTQKAGEILEHIRQARRRNTVPKTLLALAAQITDCNAAFFDAAHQYAGALSGIHEVLRRQGLLANNFTLDPLETLSPGQSAEIDRVYRAYPHLNDDAFVRENLAAWLRP
jgi:dihydrodipicolinate synthase/N-acetylneuraminate lyase